MNPALPVRMEFRTEALAAPAVTGISRVTTPLAFTISGLALGLLLFSTGCQQEPAVSPDLRGRIVPVAEDFCEKIVTCVRNDMEERLRDEPQRRFYLQGRMTQTTCVEAQVRALAKRADDLAALQQCSRTLAEKSSCADRLSLLGTSPCNTALDLK